MMLSRRNGDHSKAHWFSRRTSSSSSGVKSFCTFKARLFTDVTLQARNMEFIYKETFVDAPDRFKEIRLKHLNQECQNLVFVVDK